MVEKAANSGSSRIRIKLGHLEIEFEGSESFLENHLPNLVELLASVTPPVTDDVETDQEEELLGESSDPSSKKLNMSTSTIANQIDAKSGRDLVIAACAHLHFVKGHRKYERKNILSEMKTATSYYKKTYGNTLTTTLRRLVKGGDLNEVAENTFALDSKAAADLERKLSGK